MFDDPTPQGSGSQRHAPQQPHQQPQRMSESATSDGGLSAALRRRVRSASFTGSTTDVLDAAPRDPEAGSDAVSGEGPSADKKLTLAGFVSFVPDMDGVAAYRNPGAWPRRWPTAVFEDEALELEYLRFLMRSDQTGATAAGIVNFVVVVIAAGYYGAFQDTVLRFAVALIPIAACIAALSAALNFVIGRMETTIDDFARESTLAAWHQRITAVIMALFAVQNVFYFPASARHCVLHAGGTDAACTYAVSTAYVATLGVLTFAFTARSLLVALAQVLTLACLLTGVGVFGPGCFKTREWALFAVVHAAITVQFVVIAYVREAAFRDRFVVTVRTHTAHRTVELHGSTMWSVVRAVVPQSILPRLRSTRDVSAIRFCDHSATAVVAVTSVPNFSTWAQGMLPFAVVLTMHKLFQAFDRSLANVDAAVVNKTLITGDSYVVSGGLVTPSSTSSRSSPTGAGGRHQPYAGSDMMSASDLLLLVVDIAHDHIVSGQATDPAVPLSTGVAVGEAWGGIAGAATLRYVLTGPAVVRSFQLQLQCPPRTVGVHQEEWDLLVRDHAQQVEATASPDGSVFWVSRAARDEGSPGLHTYVIGSDLAASPNTRSPQGGMSPRNSVGGRTPNPPVSPQHAPAAPSGTGSPGSRDFSEQPAAPPSVDGLPAVAPMIQFLPDDAPQPAAPTTAAPLSSSSHVSERALSVVASASRSTLISTATSEVRTQLVDDDTVAELLVRVDDLMATDRCTRQFSADGIEPAFRRYSIEDVRASLKAVVPVAAAAHVLLLALLLVDRFTYEPTCYDTASDSTHTRDGLRTGDVEAIVLLLVGIAVIAVRYTLEVACDITVHVPIDVVGIGVASATAGGALSFARDTLVGNSVTYLVPLLGCVTVFVLRRTMWVVVAATIVVCIGVPQAVVAIVVHRSTEAAVVSCAGALFMSIAAAAVDHGQRLRFTSAILAGEFLSVARERVAVQEQLVRGILPPHVVQPVVNMLDVPEEMRLMNDQPQFVEVWEELCIVNIRCDAPPEETVKAFSLGPSNRGSRRSSSAAGAVPFEVMISRMEDVQRSIATDDGNLLAIIDVVGDVVTVAGPLGVPTQLGLARAPVAQVCLAAVVALQRLAVAFALRKDAFTAVAVVDSGFGSLFGAQMLHYCVLGMARRTAAAAIIAAPDPVFGARRSAAYASDSFQRVCTRADPSNPLVAPGAAAGGSGSPAERAFSDAAQWRVRGAGSQRYHRVALPTAIVADEFAGA